jgi:hypothetical protein
MRPNVTENFTTTLDARRPRYPTPPDNVLAIAAHDGARLIDDPRQTETNGGSVAASRSRGTTYGRRV